MKKEDIKKNINKQLKMYYELFLDKKSNNIPVSGKLYNEKELISVVDTLLEGHWTEGKTTEEFEKKFCNFLGIQNTIVVNSGSSANLLSLKCLKSPKLGDRRLKPGDEVITVAAGFPTTINPIIQCGCIPVFCDVDLQTYNINILQLKKAITQKTKAIILAHTLGNPFNITAVKKICKANNLWLIEDCCDALGSKYKNKFVGTYGDISTFSFYPAHHITMAEGGAVCTNSSLLNKIIRSMRDWGRDCICRTGEDNRCNNRYNWKFGELPVGFDHKYVYSEIGYNLKNTDLNVAIGLAQLDKLEEFNKKRNKNFKLLKEGLFHLREYLILPKSQISSIPSWFGFPITLSENCMFERDVLLKYLNDNNIGTRLLFSGNITKQPCFIDNNINYRIVGELYNTNIIMEKTFWIGVCPLINENDIKKIINTVESFIFNE